MIISHKYKTIFIHVHRTGGTTIGNLLIEEMGTKVETISQHGNAKTEESALLEAHPNYFTFGFVRNPWDRLLSWYSRLYEPADTKIGIKETRRDFEAFLIGLAKNDHDDAFHMNQLDYFTDKNGKPHFDKIGRFESFETDVIDIFETLGHDIHRIPKLNVTSEKRYQDYYTDVAQKTISEACRGDIAQFGYQF